jgi:hypothetical protein
MNQEMNHSTVADLSRLRAPLDQVGDVSKNLARAAGLLRSSKLGKCAGRAAHCFTAAIRECSESVPQ